MYCLSYQINEEYKKRRSLKRNKKRSSDPENIDLCTCSNGCFSKNVYISLVVDVKYYGGNKNVTKHLISFRDRINNSLNFNNYQ